MKAAGPKPVQGRRCGDCKACCHDVQIDTPEFHKDAGSLCTHHTGTGCGIYSRRPEACRAFLCGWLLFPELGNEWRPDRSGAIIIQIPQDSLPQKYRAAGHGVMFVISDGDEAITRPGFADYVAGLVSRGIAVYLAVTAPHALINEHLEPGMTKDLSAVVEILRHVRGLQRAARERKGFMGALPHFYGLQLARWRARVGKKLRTTNE